MSSKKCIKLARNTCLSPGESEFTGISTLKKDGGLEGFADKFKMIVHIELRWIIFRCTSDPGIWLSFFSMLK